MVIRLCTYCLLLLFCLCALHSHAQWGISIINQDFGLGNEDPGTIGSPLPPGTTDFTFSNQWCPPAGSYTIARRINIKSCFNNKWIDLSSDATSDWVFGADLSNMMLVNNDGLTDPRVLYQDTTRTALCAGSTFEFSMSVINLDLPTFCNTPLFPAIELEVLNAATGQVIATRQTGDIMYASPIPRYTFSIHALNFVLPPGVDRLVVKLLLLPVYGYKNCGGDFAIDDILLRSTGPTIKIGFDDLPAGYSVSSVCFQDNKTISMTGNMDPFYTTPLLQWQQSTDNGTSWTDIPGATANNYASTFSTPDTFLFRLSGGDASNMANQNCRVISNIIKVNVEGIPSDFAVTSNSPVCAGQDLTLNATGGAAYTWSGPNGFSDDVYYAHIYNSTLADSGIYYVDIKTAGGCQARGSTYVKVIGTDVTAGPDTSVCQGRTVQLRASQGISYAWSPATGLSKTTIANPVASPGATTIYSVMVTDKDGCTAEARATVTVLNKIAVKAAIEGTDNLCRYYDSASFKNKSTGNIAAWNWNFGNGQTSTLPNPPVQYYSSAGNETSFIAQLAVKDTSGCADTAWHVLKVINNCFIAVPTAFTPNGDGSNDYLYPLNAYKATNLSFRVYNRNGQLVFETKDWTRKWNGTIKGNPQPVGAYVWMLDYTDAAGKKVSLKGTTALIR